MTEALGASFARAVAGNDYARVLDLLHPDVDFRGMTPSRYWEAQGPEGVVNTLHTWFEGDRIEGIDALETDRFADRERVGYRLRVRNDEGLTLVEQQAYISEQDGRIAWLRIMCSGNRPIEG